MIADHGRGATVLLADGVVPSNEERGYVLRRIMRRAIQQGHVLGIDEPFLVRVCERVRDVMGDAYPEPRARVAHDRALGARRGGELQPHARAGRAPARRGDRPREGASRPRGSSAEDAFRLHDTFGFPYEMTKELLAEEGLSVDDQGFEELMERAREVSRRGSSRTRATADGGGGSEVHVEHDDLLRFAREAGFRTRFVGYETTEADTVLRVAERANGWLLAKLEESPFYPEGGGQISDIGLVETPVGPRAGGGRLPRGRRPGARARAGRGRDRARGRPCGRSSSATAGSPRCATTPPRTCSTRRCAQRLGTHVRQAGSYVGPDKLRFDFTHGERLSPEDLAEVERLVGGWLAAQPSRARDRDDARRGRAPRRDGAVRREVRRARADGGDRGRVARAVRRHARGRRPSEIGLFHVTTETSSASNVRRIEAVTGPEAARLFQERTQRLNEIAARLKVPEHEVVNAVERLSARVKELRAEAEGGGVDRERPDELVADAEETAASPW